MFHNIEAPVFQPKQGEMRVFVGDGSPVLKVPGVKRIHELRVGPVVVPEMKTRIAKDALNPGANIALRIPNWIIQRDLDGDLCVLRSIECNDGIWQKGSRIFITADWEPEPKEAAEAAEPVKATARK